MKIAFIVLAYCDPQQLLAQTIELVKSGDVFIHINKKVKINDFIDVIKVFDNNPNVRFVDKRIATNWAGFSLVMAAMESLKQCLNTKDYDRIVLLTGQDYPIKSPKYIKEYFQTHYQDEFIKSVRYGKLEKPSSFQVIIRDSKVYMKLYSMLSRIIPENKLTIKSESIKVNGKHYGIHGLSPKWALTGKTAKKILALYQHSFWLNMYFRTMHAPDDYYVATLSRVIGLEDNLFSKDNLFFEIHNNKKAGESCKTISEEDYEELVKTQSLFARKFFSGESASVVRLLSQRNETNN